MKISLVYMSNESPCNFLKGDVTPIPIPYLVFRWCSNENWTYKNLGGTLHVGSIGGVIQKQTTENIKNTLQKLFDSVYFFNL